MSWSIFNSYDVNPDGNMASIQRQLNLYGFRCTNRIDEKGVFCHPNFIRGQYDQVRNIRRKKTWPTKRKQKADASTEAAVPSSTSRGKASSSRDAPEVGMVPLTRPEKYERSLSETSEAFSPLPDCATPLSHIFESEYANLLDFFDDKSLDEMMMMNTASLDSADFDQNLLKLFSDDEYSCEINLQ
jgi:hypothetical protein